MSAFTFQKHSSALLALTLMFPQPHLAAHASYSWDTLPHLPPSAGQRSQPGVAGPFAGAHAGVLIVAGGANFPDKMPWDGGTKTWWDDIWIFDPASGSTGAWIGGVTQRLPRPLGYGVSVSTPEGVVCAGGNDATRCYAEVFMLSWDRAAREIRRTELPSMPKPLAMMAGAIVGSTLYIAGGQHSTTSSTASLAFWALDLSKRGDPSAFRWKTLAPWPGPERVLPVAAAAPTRTGEAFLLFSGRTPMPGKATRLLTDAYAYDPATGRWSTLAPVGGGGGHCAMAGAAWTAPDGEVLIIGGDRGERFAELEGHDLEIARLRGVLAGATDSVRGEIQKRIDEHLAAKRGIYDIHPGFGRDVFGYDARTDTWRIAERSPGMPQVTTLAVSFGNAAVIPSGEIRPGVRTPAIVRIGLKGTR